MVRIVILDVFQLRSADCDLSSPAYLSHRLFRRETYLLAGRGLPLINSAFLYTRHPKREEGIQQSVCGYCRGRVVLGALEAKLVVPAEASGCYCEGAVAEG